jgi:hypothetical protein
MENFDQEIKEELPFGHSDKIIGLFSEPAKTFETMSRSVPKNIDWLMPVSLLFIIIILTRVVIMNNSDLAFQSKQLQKEKIEQSLNSLVEKKQITPEQKEERLNQTMDNMNKPIYQFIGFIGILIGGFIFFFIVTGIYFLFAKFALKGEGTYTSALVANGMTAYITMFSLILATILSYAFGRIVNDVSIASLMNADKTTIGGFLLSKIDVISIWGYIIMSIAFAKMFKSAKTGKYYGMIFGIWIGWSIFSFWLGKAVPWLNFNQ